MNPFPYNINENTKPVKLIDEPQIPKFRPDIGFYPNIPFKPDWTPDFSEHIDIEADSIGLALSTLNLSKAEYNAMSIDQLKNLRRIDFQAGNIYAINILIHYKQNSKNLSFPQITPIFHNHIKPKIYHFEDEKTFGKIYPEID